MCAPRRQYKVASKADEKSALAFVMTGLDTSKLDSAIKAMNSKAWKNLKSAKVGLNHLDYEWKATTLMASELRLPHRRRRLWIVGVHRPFIEAVGSTAEAIWQRFDGCIARVTGGLEPMIPPDLFQDDLEQESAHEEAGLLS